MSTGTLPLNRIRIYSFRSHIDGETMDIEDLREDVYWANMELQSRGLVLYTWGNASGIDRKKGIVAIKPSGIAYEELKPELIVLVDLSGKVLEGDLKPSSDTPTHLELYKAFPEIGGIVHTHSAHATAWAQAMEPIPCFGTTHADHFNGEVPVTEPLTDAEIAGDYEAATGRSIVRVFRDKNKDYKAVPAVLCANHGPFTWGETPDKAVYTAVVLEEVARIALMTRAISPECGPVNQKLLDKHFQRKHGPNAYYGQGGEHG